MIRRKKSKIYKLKKKHVWPSVVLFFTYNCIVCVFFVVVSQFFIENHIYNRLLQGQDKVETLALDVNMQLEKSKNMKSALSTFHKKYSNYEAGAIVNKDKKVIEKFGHISIDKKRPVVGYHVGDGFCYYDKSSKDALFYKDKKTHIKAYNLLGATADGWITIGLLNRDSSWWEEIIFTDSYWMAVPLDNSDYYLMLKCKLDLYRDDLIYAVYMFLTVLALLCIPVVILFVNVIIQIRTQRRVYHIFYNDPVTKGKNWMYFLHQSEKLLESYMGAGRTYAIVDLQLQKYRSYCACNGVAAGEELLERINHMIDLQTGKNELVVRYAKANYALLIVCADDVECKDRISHMINTLADRTSSTHLTFQAGVIMLYPSRKKETGRIIRRSGIDVPQLYNYASEARASIEEGDENAIAFFDQMMLEEQLWEHWVENAMEHAMENEEFIVYLQPKYNPVTNELVGAEALVRWISEEKGFIPPNRFIPIFEKNGFISKLDDYMISHVAKQQSQWLAENKKVVPVSVNVSRMHFALDNLAEHICSLVDEYHTPHDVIEIELTESAFFDNKKTLLNTVSKLKEYGFELSMDDFGSGYSSLNSLKDLPLDVLKIDAGFFRGEETTTQRGEIIIGETIQLAKRLNMRTVAEGIETKEQTDFLALLGCDMIQGYYYAKPMPVQEFEDRAFS